MARIFTLPFNFKDQWHSALVSIYIKEKNIVSFKVHVYNEDLHRLLPQGILNFNIVEGMTTPATLQNALTEELIKCIIDAVANHLANDAINSNILMGKTQKTA